jgi:hypothetical protein
MTEPRHGDRVRFKDGGTVREGIVTEVFTAGRPSGTGLHRQRRRVQIRFAADGQAWATCRDCDAITIAGQPSLFDFEASA